ncbi:HI0074 family nucleotidyltransferase substrate-binding subunit [Cysteiniphilum sp. 6C5]|uniref:HI0074 family nucleotidyltransferase substrate-binding subunit n=1 Tax=unclassified Cysteiniphilum TaxID=2610889 RepID=UPI003F857342
MTITPPLRWKLRFENFSKAYHVLQRRVTEYQQHQDSEAYQMALIQGFEIIIELSWKVLKDYLENEGFQEVSTPKTVIRQAYQSNIIDQGELWLEALQLRNLASHTYDETTTKIMLTFIVDKYLKLVTQLYQTLESQQ